VLVWCWRFVHRLSGAGDQAAELLLGITQAVIAPQGATNFVLVRIGLTIINFEASRAEMGRYDGDDRDFVLYMASAFGNPPKNRDIPLAVVLENNNGYLMQLSAEELPLARSLRASLHAEVLGSFQWMGPGEPGSADVQSVHPSAW
jgi:hypothetical protein